jgi:hypothetical protein
VRVVGIWPNLRRCIPPAEPRWCLIRARTIQTGKCRERPEETSVLLLSEPPVIALSHAGPWARFFLRQNRMAGARRTFGPARSYYLKTIEGTSQSLWLPHTAKAKFFCDWGEPLPQWCVFRLAGRAAPPSPIPSRPVPLEPRCNFAGALRFQRPSQPLPLLPRSPLLTLTLLRQPVLTYAVAPAHGP